MRLGFNPNPQPHSRYPQGYWHAATDDGMHTAQGVTPEAAIAALAIELEQELTWRTAPVLERRAAALVDDLREKRPDLPNGV